MKIAVSSDGKDLESQVETRFGRCPYFIIVEVDDNKIKSSKIMKNTAAGQMGGAGITSAELVANKDVKAVITGNMGPRAFDVFQQLDISVYQGTGTIKDVIEKFVNNKLEKISGPTGPMGVGMPGNEHNKKMKK